jgi:hypothetical protein
MTNDAKPHRKFCQTFVLAPQPHGYFLLNDILRFMSEEDDEPLEAQPEATVAEESTPVAEELEDASVVEHVDNDSSAPKVDTELEETKATEPEKVNGIHHVAEEESTQVDETTVGDKAAIESKAEVPEQETKELAAEPEKPLESTPTPVEPKTTSKTTPAPFKPAVPLSWAQRIAGGSGAKAAAPVAAASTSVAPAQAKQASTSPTATKKTSNQTSSSNTVTAPARQPSPTDSAHEGSQGGWQTAGVDHSRTKSRSGPAVTDNGHVRAYVKNVFASVGADELKAELEKYGELAYYDVSRAKVSLLICTIDIMLLTRLLELCICRIRFR